MPLKFVSDRYGAKASTAVQRSIGENDMKNIIRFAISSQALFIISGLIAQAPAWAGTPFHTLETPDARIIHSETNTNLAARTAKIVAFAVRRVGENFGPPQHRVTVYIHDSAKDMSEGLMTTLGFDRVSAETIARVGISMRTRDMLHIHRRAGKWGKLFWHAVVHEHTHGMVEELYGPDIATKARWIYEGLGDYEANRTLRTRFPETEEKYTVWMDRSAFKALILGRLLRLEDISTNLKWDANIRSGRGPWVTQYALANVAVRYAVGKYGLEKIKQVLKRIRSGTPYQDAMRDVLGVSLVWFEVRYLADLFLRGLLEFYVHYTLAVAGGMIALIGSVSLVLFRRRRTKTAVSSGAESR